MLKLKVCATTLLYSAFYVGAVGSDSEPAGATKQDPV